MNQEIASLLKQNGDYAVLTISRVSPTQLRLVANFHAEPVPIAPICLDVEKPEELDAPLDMTKLLEAKTTAEAAIAKAAEETAKAADEKAKAARPKRVPPPKPAPAPAKPAKPEGEGEESGSEEAQLAGEIKPATTGELF